MNHARHECRCACLLTSGLLLLGACGGQPPDTATNAPSNTPAKASADRGTAARDGCAAMTDEVAAIAGLELRRPLELHAPEEGVLRGCTWTDTRGALNTFGMTKEPAGRYGEHHEDKYRKAFPERFKRLEGFGDKGFVSPVALEGWTACALRAPECFCVEITGEATTEDQATRLLRLALDRF